MRYKSKKMNRNRNRYFKRQSRKRIYGGGVEMSNSNLSNQQLSNDADEIMSKIEEQNKIEMPALEEIPIIGPVIKKTGNLVEGSLVKGLDIIGDSVGIDIDNPESFGEKLEDIKYAISNEENVKKTKEILDNAGKYVEIGIDAASPILEKTADKILPVVIKETDKAVKAGLATLVNLAEDVAGPFIGIPRTILSAAKAFNASVNAGSELVKGTAEVIQGTQENYNKIINETTQNIPKVPEMPRFQATTQTAGGSLKKIKKEVIMVGGRINDAKIEFLSNNIKSSDFLQQQGGKIHTKRRHYFRKNHKLTLRKR